MAQNLIEINWKNIIINRRFRISNESEQNLDKREEIEDYKSL